MKRVLGVGVCGGGIKCDNPECDFADANVEIEDYINWLNKPCPICGSNLLTQQDYDNVHKILEAVNFVNENFEIVESEDKENTLSFHMNGSGEVVAELDY